MTEREPTQTVETSGNNADSQRELLIRELMKVGARGAGGKVGRLGAVATFAGDVEDLPDHVERIAERYDLVVVHNQTEVGGRGLETRVELATDERLETIQDFRDDVEVLFDPDEDESELPYECDLCGARYYGAGAALGCCSDRVATDGGVDLDPDAEVDGVDELDQDDDRTPLEVLADVDERLHPSVNPGARLVQDDQVRHVEIAAVGDVDETGRGWVQQQARARGLERWAKYEVTDAARTGRVGETADGQVYVLKLREGELRLEDAELVVPDVVRRLEDDEDDEDGELVADGGFVTEVPGAEWCPDCQRERINCAHMADDTLED